MTEQPKASIPRKPSRILAWFRKKSLIGKIVTLIILAWLCVLFVAERNCYAWIFLLLRKYISIVILSFFLILMLYKAFKVSRKKGKVLLIVLLLMVIGSCIMTGLTPWAMYGYVSGYVRYTTLNQVPIQILPETAYEPIQPQISIQTLAEQRLQETETVSPPFQIRDGSEFRWTMAKEPSQQYVYQRLFGKIKTVFSVSTQAPSPNFSDKNLVDVDFAIGKTLLLSCEIHTAVIRKQSFFDLFSIETGEPRFMRDDLGNWVQVVPLIRWEGIFFPQPAFGGVHVINQGHVTSVGEFIKRFLFGVGVTYSPEEMKKFAYLQNQNLMPTIISETIAKSFRYKNGFFAPLPIYHEGDTRIPKMDDGIGDQPIVEYFKMSAVSPRSRDMLFDYFGLEPFDTTKHGIITSLFVPKDGQMIVYVYEHGEDGMAGMSAIPSKIRESRPTTDWSINKIADVRCYNRVIGGKSRSFWMTSVVTKTQNLHGFVSGGLPATAIVDSKYDRVVWVNPEKPETWQSDIESQLSRSWKE